MNATSNLDRYNPDEMNGLVDPAAYYARETVYMTLRELIDAGGKVTRVRMLTERRGSVRIVDMSYVHGMLPDGRRVSITRVPRMTTWHKVTSDLIEWAKEEGVYAKGAGLLDRANWSAMF